MSLTLVGIGKAILNSQFAADGWLACCFSLPDEKPILVWVVAALSGVCGGATFSLKWLYHSVAKGLWSRDRTIWRFVVPVISGIVAVFVSFLVISGIIPFLSRASINNFYAALGLGFVAGVFSDNVIAALQNTAKRIFGTTKDSKQLEAGAADPDLPQNDA